MSQPRRPRHPAEGGYARGDETRKRIIEAALQLFGERGYDGASTRDIAQAAGVNAPALQYYFHNKEGVYQACAENLVEQLKQHFADATAHARALLAQPGERGALIDAYLQVQARALSLLLSPEHATFKNMFSREYAGEALSSGSSLLDREVKQPMNALLLNLLARIMGSRPDDNITRIRLLTLKGQTMAFHYPPGACLELLKWKRMDTRHANMVKQAIAEQTRILLETWAREADRHASD